VVWYNALQQEVLMARLVRLFYRPGCMVCDELRDTLELLQGQLSFELLAVNILDDLGLYQCFRQRVPLVQVQDGPICEGPFDEARLRVLLGSAVDT
jgi:hypothetical protein